MGATAWALLADALLVLEFSQAKQNDVTDADPHALSQLATNVTEPVDTVEAKRFQPAVAEHARDLGVLCSRGGRRESRCWSGGGGSQLVSLRVRKKPDRQRRTLPVFLEGKLTLHVAIRLATTAVLAALRTSRQCTKGEASRPAGVGGC